MTGIYALGGVCEHLHEDAPACEAIRGGVTDLVLRDMRRYGEGAILVWPARSVGGHIGTVILIEEESMSHTSRAVVAAVIATILLTFGLSGVSSANPNCWFGMWIKSNANGMYVSAELGGVPYPYYDYGRLRARATAVGPWERFTICQISADGLTTIQSEANGLYVSAEIGADLRLRARSDRVGPWEGFYLPWQGGYPSWPQDGLWIRSAANGQFVAAEMGATGNNYGLLRARSGAVGPWERFTRR